MSSRLLAATVAVALAGCGILPGAPSGPVGPRSCPNLITLPEAAPDAWPAPETTTLRDLLHWKFDMEAYAAALQRQARAREAQIDEHKPRAVMVMREELIRLAVGWLDELPDHVAETTSNDMLRWSWRGYVRKHHKSDELLVLAHARSGR